MRGSAWATGANEEGKHAVDVVIGRDFAPAGVVPAAEVREGDPCGRCGSPLTIGRGIEIGHIFQLGRKYADAFGLDVLGPDSKPVRVTMGSYGVGVSRAVAAIAEQSLRREGPGLAAVGRARRRARRRHRQAGPAARSPSGSRPSSRGAGSRCCSTTAARCRRAWRSRTPSCSASRPPSWSARRMADGHVEVKDRRSGEVRTVPVDEVVEAVVREVRA